MSFPAFQLPPNTSSQTDLEASNKKPIYVAVAVGFFLATGAVTLRGVARRKTKATFGSDDYTIVFALVYSPAPHVLPSTLQSAKFWTRFFSMRSTSRPSYLLPSMDWVDISPPCFS